MGKKSRQFLFTAESEQEDGSIKSFRVYKSGRDFYISPSGEFGREHLCHPSVRDQSKIKTEIMLVYHCKVTNIRYDD